MLQALSILNQQLDDVNMQTNASSIKKINTNAPAHLIEEIVEIYLEKKFTIASCM
jgi:hypothetical protein